MTVTTQNSYIIANGDGSNTTFAYNMIIPYQDDGITPAVGVSLMDPSGNVIPVIPSDFSLTGVNDPAGGIVTWPLAGAPLPAGWKIAIFRDLAYTQGTQVTNYQFYPHTTEELADRLEEQIQQLVQLYGTGGSFPFPPPAPPPPGPTITRSVQFIIDGGGVAITTGIKGNLSVPINCTIQSCELLADQSGDISVEIWAAPIGSYPPLTGGDITNGGASMTGVDHATVALTGWTTLLVANDTLRYNVVSTSGDIETLTVALKVVG